MTTLAHIPAEDALTILLALIALVLLFALMAIRSTYYMAKLSAWAESNRAADAHREFVYAEECFRRGIPVHMPVHNLHARDPRKPLLKQLLPPEKLQPAIPNPPTNLSIAKAIIRKHLVSEKVAGWRISGTEE